MQFRKDINGLRAIAVIAVVLFHFNQNWMPGGFAGVDVFFVISGFLMTGIIFRGIEQENFSILKFYIARANRIIPALAVLCLTLLVFGWFYLTPLDYKVLGKHIGSSIGFFSNIIYWRESGYFDAASHEKWLLHTWSLSAEWQFYILYPLALVAMRKFMSLKVMKATVLAATGLGFIFCIFATYKWPNPAYYLLHTRAWEMMAGGVACLYPLKLTENKKKLFEWSGLALIAMSYLFISKENLWPGYLAFIPVLGAFLLIQAQRNNSFVTGNFLFQSLGKWSYSIYLWHWPIVVAIYYFSFNEMFVYLGIALSITLGFLSNTYIETIKFRNDFKGIANHLTCKPMYLVIFVGLLGSATFISHGFEWHYNQNVLVADKEASNKNPRRDECHVGSGKVPECTYGRGELGAIVIGDSHAQSIIRSVEKSLEHQKVLDWTMSGCRTIKNIFNRRQGIEDKSCGEFVSYALKEIKNYPDVPVIVDNRYMAMLLGPNEPALQDRTLKPDDFVPATQDSTRRNRDYKQAMNKAFTNTVCSLSKNNPLFLLEQTPELKYNVPKTMAKEFLKGNEDFRVKISLNEYKHRNAEFYRLAESIKDKCDITIISVKNNFCDSQYCYGDINGRPAYFDDNHLSEYGASQLIPTFKKALTHI